MLNEKYNDYIKHFNSSYNRVDVNLCQFEIAIGQKFGKYKTNRIEELKFLLIRESCEFVKSKKHNKKGGTFLLCDNGKNPKYYCNYRTCPLLHNKNGANEI